MDPKALFDAIRRIKGSPLTEADVALVNSVIDDKPFTLPVPTVDPKLLAALKVDEGCRLIAYQDTVGVWTIGYGHTAGVHPGQTITQAQADAWLTEDVASHNAATHRALPWLRNLDPVRRRVIENMGFNLGVDRLLGFKNTLAYVQTGQYAQAADNMLQSKWAKQVKGRAVRLAKEMRTGVE